MAFELTSTGLTIQTVAEIQQEIGDAMKANVDPLINVAPDSLDGQEIAINASAEREVQEVIQALADAIDPDNAEGERLDVIGSLRGIPRKAATKSSFKGTRGVTMNVGAGQTIAAGQVAHVLGHPEIRFVSLAAADNSAGVTNTDILLVPFECEVTGPIHANAGTLTVIATPASGWNSVTNPLDPLLGTDVETDGAYHDRQEEELAQAGTSTVNAIRSAVLQLEQADSPGVFPVIDAFVLENDTDVTANGVPPHSFETIVWDGNGAEADDEDLAALIFAHKPAGIRAYGSHTESVEDSYGFFHVVQFTRPTQRQFKIHVTGLVDATTYVGDAAVKTALADAAVGVKPADAPAALKVGQSPAKNVKFSPYLAIVQILPGVNEIIDFQIAFVGDAFTSFQDLTIALREIAVTDTSVITLDFEPG